MISDLNDKDESALYNRIVLSEEPKTHTRCLTLTTIQNWALKKNSRYFPILKGNQTLHQGFLSCFDKGGKFNYEMTLEKSFGFFILLFDHFKTKLSDQWELGDSAGGFISMNIGISSIFLITEDIIEFIIYKKKINPMTLNDMELFQQISPIIDKLLVYITELDDSIIKDFRSKFGSGGPPFVVKHYQKYLYENTNKEFNPVGLEEWIDNQKGEYRMKCIELDAMLRPKLNNFITNYLKEKHGEEEEEWFNGGCPQTVITRCAEERYKASKRGETPRDDSTYLNLIDYHSIIFSSDNYGDLSLIFSPPGLENKKKEEKLKWLKSYEKIRNKWSHQDESGQVINKNDYETINEIYTWLVPKLN